MIYQTTVKFYTDEIIDNELISLKRISDVEEQPLVSLTEEQFKYFKEQSISLEDKESWLKFLTDELYEMYITCSSEQKENSIKQLYNLIDKLKEEGF